MAKLYKKVSDKWWLVSMMLVSGGVQLSFITKSSIWHDEGYTMLLAPQGVADIITRTARDVHPPLYYLKLHYWLELFGNSETAARSFSVLCIVLTIAVTFALSKRLFGSGAARLGALFMALAPFLVRYGQEARMYGMAALLASLATYVLVSALDLQSKKRLYLYGFIMAAALYTHYYAIFMVPAHWIYVGMRTGWRKRVRGQLDLRSIHWWIANLLAIVLFAPWLPVAYSQFTRVQGGFWIPEVDIFTLPSTLAQYLHFTSWDQIWHWWRVIILIVFVVIIAIALYANRLQRRSLSLLIVWAALAPLTVFGLSILARPIFVQRYFVFAAVPVYGLIAVLLYLKPLNLFTKLRSLAIIGLLVLFGYGIRQVYLQSNHQMRNVGNAVSQQFQRGDEMVAGELYVYLDFSYYNQTGQKLKLYSPDGISGYGETSLFYDHADQVVVKGYESMKPTSGYVWLIGKAGQKSYYDEVPEYWQQDREIVAKESVAKRYKVGTPNLQSGNANRVCAQVITSGRNQTTGELKSFSSSCLPSGWVAVPAE